MVDQARAKVDKQVGALRSQVSAVETRERQATPAHADSFAEMEASCGAAVYAEQGLRQSAHSLKQDLRTTREQLLNAQQNATRYGTYAETVQTLLDCLRASPTPATASTKPSRKRTAWTPPKNLPRIGRQAHKSLICIAIARFRRVTAAAEVRRTTQHQARWSQEM